MAIFWFALSALYYPRYGSVKKACIQTEIKGRMMMEPSTETKVETTVANGGSEDGQVGMVHEEKENSKEQEEKDMPEMVDGQSTEEENETSDKMDVSMQGKDGRIETDRDIGEDERHEENEKKDSAQSESKEAISEQASTTSSSVVVVPQEPIQNARPKGEKPSKKRNKKTKGKKSGPKETLVIGNFEGKLEENIRTGPGKLTWSDGSSYVGDFLNGMREGEGTYITEHGKHTYKGGWKQSQKHGKGVESWANGETYIGEYRLGKFHGKGVYASRRGRYEGMWTNGLKDGKGRMEWKHGDIYEGHWKQGRMHGSGTYTRGSDESMYIGEWKYGTRHGEGQQVEKDGYKYDGEWADNKKHGVGIVRYPNGRWRKGQFENGEKKMWLTDERIG